MKRRDRAEADRFFNYPYAAIEELLVNAIYHRSYEEREPIEVRVLPDSITITSYPGPDRSVKIEDLASGSVIARRYRNRRIGEFLKELRLTEGRGTGIPTAIRAMNENGSPRPVFATDEERTYFTVTLPVHSHILQQEMPPQVTPQVTPQGHDQVKIQDAGSRADTRLRLILEFCVSPRDRVSIQARVHLKDPRNFRDRYLTPLLNEKLLAMTDPDHPKVPTQKYRTTDKGNDYLKQDTTALLGI